MPPLAQRLRPRSLDDVCGQRHLLAPGQVFRRTVETAARTGRLPNMIFYGPSGVGKTTVANIIAEQSGMRLHRLNGTTASTADIKAVLAETETIAAGQGILLYLDRNPVFQQTPAAKPARLPGTGYRDPDCLNHRKPVLLHL